MPLQAYDRNVGPATFECVLLGEGNFIFCRTGSRITISGWSVGKITIIFFALKAGTSKKNIDHQGKEICAYESDHISLLYDSTVPSVLNFCFLSILLQSKRKRSY